MASKSDNELAFVGQTHPKLKQNARKNARKELSAFFEDNFIQENGDMFFPNTITSFADPPGDYKSKLRKEFGNIRDKWITISRRMIRKQKTNNNFRHQQKITRSSSSFVIYDMLYVSKGWILKHWVESLSNAIGDEFVIKLKAS